MKSALLSDRSDRSDAYTQIIFVLILMAVMLKNRFVVRDIEQCSLLQNRIGVKFDSPLHEVKVVVPTFENIHCF